MVTRLDTQENTESLPVKSSYTPPPSQLGGRGFAAFAETAVLERGKPAPDLTPDLPRPARAVNWREFDEVVRGLDPEGVSELPQLDLEPEYGRLATASLVVSLSGIVTGIGFLVGTVMGQVTLRRIGRAGWLERNEPARNRSRNAVMIGYTGMAVLATAALLAAGWWLMQTPLDQLLPGVDAGTAPVTPANGATP